MLNPQISNSPIQNARADVGEIHLELPMTVCCARANPYRFLSTVLHLNSHDLSCFAIIATGINEDSLRLEGCSTY